MAGRIPAIKLDLVWWNDDPSADRNMVAMQFGVVAVVGDDGYGLAVWSGPDLVSPVGIGLAAAKRFIEEGAFVFIFGRRQEALDAAEADLGPNARAVKGSVSDEADLDRLYAAVKAERGTLDIVFANAGAGSPLALGKITAEHLDETFDTNVKGTIFTVQKALPLMGQGGSIILTGSSAGTTGVPAMSAYSASKAAVRNLARTWAADLKGTGIRVNVLSPGATATELAKAALGEEGQKAYAAMTPLQRMADPAEIGAVAAFLASSDSGFTPPSAALAGGGPDRARITFSTSITSLVFQAEMRTLRTDTPRGQPARLEVRARRRAQGSCVRLGAHRRILDSSHLNLSISKSSSCSQFAASSSGASPARRQGSGPACRRPCAAHRDGSWGGEERNRFDRAPSGKLSSLKLGFFPHFCAAAMVITSVATPCAARRAYWESAHAPPVSGMRDRNSHLAVL